MRSILLVVTFILMISPAYGEDIYNWTDRSGVAHFTDDLGNVPRSYRTNVGVRGYPSEGETPVGLEQENPRPVSKIEEAEKETKVDLHGQDEGFWRGKVRPWEGRLEEATVNYCGAQDEFMRIAEELSQMRFGSPTQYKAKIARLDDAKFEMQKYQGQITEAKLALEKISKEAKEAGANPDWLK
jgi:hypothetical protein